MANWYDVVMAVIFSTCTIGTIIYWLLIFTSDYKISPTRLKVSIVNNNVQVQIYYKMLHEWWGSPLRVKLKYLPIKIYV